MFAKNLAKKIPAHEIVNQSGLAYVSWANMLKGAGMPKHSCVTFANKPGLVVFGGLVVAVDMEFNGITQRTWLPVLSEENMAVSALNANQNALSQTQNAIARCRAKAVSMVTGYGLGLYAGMGGDGKTFMDELGVLPDSKEPLCNIKAIAENKGENGPEYLRWAPALAAAKLRDPQFQWHVDFYDGQPYMQAGEGYFVSVSSRFEGDWHTEILPIMDVWSYEPLKTPNAADWNRSVMRTLAKGIATQTGYGIALYSSDEPGLKGFEPPAPEDLRILEELVLAKQRTVEDLLRWLGIEGCDISVLSKEQTERSLQAVGYKRPD